MSKHSKITKLTSINNADHGIWRRREFISTVTKAISASALLTTPVAGFANPINQPAPPLTVQQVIDLVLKEIPRLPISGTVDTLKSGTPDQLVTGIVTTSFATIPVIEKAIALNANFIIAHEPTFYNHRDDTDWLEEDEVYLYKYSLLKKHNIAVWRFHDFWHSHRPDGVQMGVLTTLGWEKYADPEELHVINLPPTSLQQIVTHVKSKLGIQTVRVMGDPAQECKRILLLPGAPGGRRQIDALRQVKPDVLIGGELSEWETSEYMRDLQSIGIKRSLIVLGHAVSEEPGMQWLVPWLQPKVPGLTITHVPARNPFTFM
jgi:putative NIF3 family GTP cyclohydrolase 1 type 2